MDTNMKDKYFSKINKSGIAADGEIFIESATISLNYEKLNTLAKVRRAISHELAHLFPGNQKSFSFAKRWSFWNDNIKIFEETANDPDPPNTGIKNGT